MCHFQSHIATTYVDSNMSNRDLLHARSSDWLAGAARHTPTALEQPTEANRLQMIHNWISRTGNVGQKMAPRITTLLQNQKMDTACPQPPKKFGLLSSQQTIYLIITIIAYKIHEQDPY